MSTLYELTEQLAQLNQMSEDDVFDESAIKDALDTVLADVATKSDGYVKFMANINATSNAIDAEIKRLKARKDKADKMYGLMEERLLNALILTPTGIVETPTHTIKVKNNPPSVLITDESKIPGKFIKTVISTSINKTDISKALKAGQQVNGCELISKKSLSIK